MMDFLAITTVLLLGWSSVASGTGISTHIETGERAKQFLSLNSQGINYTELILKHPDAYQAGAPYPDAYYPGLCFDGNFHDVAEQTHWTPFLNATVNYIRDQYPRPWDEAGEKLVVFLLAVVQHQVADVNWHSLGIDQGFLEAMGKVNYHGSFDDAHSDGDFGGDVVNLYGLDMAYIPRVGTWYVPVDDLLQIYTELNGRNDTMYEEVIIECTNWLFLGRLGEHLGVIEYLYPRFAERSTFLIDRLQDYFLGGVDDMAVWSANVFARTVTMLDQGTEVCTLPENPIYIRCNELQTFSWRKKRSLANLRRRSRLSASRHSYDWLETAAALVEPEDFVVERSGVGVTFSTTKHFQDRVAKRSAKLNRQRRKSKLTAMSNVTLPDTFYGTRLNYSRLGEALLSADVNNDGFLDLVVSAPGYGVRGNHQMGRVYVIHGSVEGLPKSNLSLERDADYILDGPGLNGRFGTALAVVDLNADGLNDLVVSAPSIGSDILDYYGEVYVYFGSLSGLSSAPDATITCSERYCNLGWSLTSGDVNHDGFDDLLIGAPFAPSGGQQRGFVGAMFASASFTGGIFGEFDLDWKKNGEADYEWFGYSMTTSLQESPSSGWIIVGSPTQRICATPSCSSFDTGDVQAVGKVTTFSTADLANPDVQIVGNVSFAQLGYAIMGSSGSASNPFVSVAATTRDFDPGTVPEENSTVPILQLGYVSVYESGDLSQEPFFSIVGDRQFGRVGAALKFVNLNGDSSTDVIVAAPLRSETIDSGREEGRVYIFLTDEDMRGELYTVSQADVALGLGEDKARFGYSMACVTTQGGQVDLAVSAPHSNSGGRLSGLVSVHTL